MSPESNGLMILVVEEDESVRHMLQSILPQRGLPVLVAASGKQALEIYAQHAPRIGLVLMDVNMAGLSGMQTLDAMQQVNPDVRCCFMSGDTSASRWPELLNMGAVCVLEKPFRSLHELLQTLRKHLSGSP